MGFGEFVMLSSLASAVLRPLVAGLPASSSATPPQPVGQPAAPASAQKRELPAFASAPSAGGWSGAGYMPAPPSDAPPSPDRQDAKAQEETAARDRARIADWLGTMRTGDENSPLSFLRPEKTETPAYRHAVSAYGEFSGPTDEAASSEKDRL